MKISTPILQYQRCSFSCDTSCISHYNLLIHFFTFCPDASAAILSPSRGAATHESQPSFRFYDEMERETRPLDVEHSLGIKQN